MLISEEGNVHRWCSWLLSGVEQLQCKKKKKKIKTQQSKLFGYHVYKRKRNNRRQKPWGLNQMCVFSRFSRRLNKMVRRLVPDCDVRFLQSQDGSGKGAAMVTAVAFRLANQNADRQHILDTLRLSREQLLEVKRRFSEEMTRGLSKQTHKQASIKMLPTYVRSTPDGSGRFNPTSPKLWLVFDTRFLFSFFF